MAIVVKIGKRSYEFESEEDLEKAKQIFPNCPKGQNEFEYEMERAGIDFYIDI